MCSFVNYLSENFECELMYSYEYLYFDKEKLKSAANWEFAAPAFSRQQVCIYPIKLLKLFSRMFGCWNIIVISHRTTNVYSTPARRKIA